MLAISQLLVTLPKYNMIWWVLLCLVVSCSKQPTSVQSSNINTTLVWSEEFDYHGMPDTNVWSYDVGDGCPSICGWGNNELQYYTDVDSHNVSVADGKLVITARKENYGGSEFTSARLSTKGKKEWTYGTLEIKAKLPSGKGTWPALWLLPSHNAYGGWPASGEIDMMEHVGYCPDTIYGTVHTEAYNHMLGTHDGGKIHVSDAQADWHIYRLDWTPRSITWYVDGVAYHRFDNPRMTYKEWPFDQPFHLLLNVAVGGNWGGKHGVADNIWPQTMEIDYIRQYQ